MPGWFLIRKNGEQVGSSRAWSTSDVNQLKNANGCYTFIGELTNSVRTVGAWCKYPNMRGVFDFLKRKKKPRVNPMSKRMIWEPGKPARQFGRARKRRRR